MVFEDPDAIGPRKCTFSYVESLKPICMFGWELEETGTFCLPAEYKLDPCSGSINTDFAKCLAQNN